MNSDQHLRFVSVIIPTFNRATVIGKTIESVLAQTYPNVEIIVVDDGSTDDTRETLSRYGDRVHYIYQQNAGPSAARNRGARASQADYITFLDSDDLLLPTKLERQVAFLDTHPDVDIVLCGWRRVLRDGRVGERVSLPVRKLLESILLTGINGLLPTNVPLLRQKAFERTPGFDESLPSREEQDYWMQAVLAGCKFGMVNEVLCIFADTVGSWGKDMANTEKAVPIILQKVFSHPYLPTKVTALKDKVYGRVYLQLGEHHLASSRFEDDPELTIAQRYLTQAFALMPGREVWTQQVLDFIPYQAVALSGGAEPEGCLSRLMDRLFPESTRPDWLEARVRGCLDAILALRAYQMNQYSEVPHHIVRAVRHWPGLLKNRGIPAVLTKSLIQEVLHRNVRQYPPS